MDRRGIEQLPERVRPLAVSPGHTLREVVARIEATHQGICVVVGDQGELLGTITDGDIRRAMLSGVHLDEPASAVIARRVEGCYPDPVTAPLGTPPAELLALMKGRVVRQIPLIDGDGRVADMVTMDMLLPSEAPRLQAVIMAGGKGQRLRPLTTDTPKPMLPIGGKPLLERIVDQLRGAGIDDIRISTNHMAEKIEAHFGDGSDHAVTINYLREDQPLGTAGALGLMDEPDEPFFVMNGDILTTVDFASMHRFHSEHEAALTVAVREHTVEIPYGVVDVDGVEISALREKPTHRAFINAGIYLVEPALWREIPRGEASNMTDLIDRAREMGLRVCAFPIREYWLDIGLMADYERAQVEVVRLDTATTTAPAEVSK